MKETYHDYQGCLVGNYHDSNMTGKFNSWNDFKEDYHGFLSNGYDDRYHFVFRYDIYSRPNDKYVLELCVMLQRKGIYTHLYINNITQNELDTEIKQWLLERKQYLLSLWDIED